MSLLLNLKKKCLSIKYSIKYNFSFLKVLNSPFKGLMLKWYFGEIKHGTPYFLPRKWVKVTKEDCEKLLQDDLERSEKYGWKINEGRTWEFYKNYQKPIPIKYFGFDFTSLGWKTKWNDYRFEWSPSVSIVLFNKQLFISILPNIGFYRMFDKDYIKMDCYWESWLHWEYDTDKTKPKEERFKELIKKHSNTWANSNNSTDYYPMILNKKYLKLYEQILETQ